MAKTALLRERRGVAFDGVSPMWVKRHSPRKLEFVGDMWLLPVGKQPFCLTVVDKRITNQGIWISLTVGEDTAEAELSRALGVCDAQTKPGKA